MTEHRLTLRASAPRAEITYDFPTADHLRSAVQLLRHGSADFTVGGVHVVRPRLLRSLVAESLTHDEFAVDWHDDAAIYRAFRDLPAVDRGATAMYTLQYSYAAGADHPAGVQKVYLDDPKLLLTRAWELRQDPTVIAWFPGARPRSRRVQVTGLTFVRDTVLQHAMQAMPVVASELRARIPAGTPAQRQGQSLAG